MTDTALTNSTPPVDMARVGDILDRCTGNGRCQKVCPTLTITGDESLKSPRGRIGELRLLVKNGRPSDDFAESLSTCLLCRACETACPENLELGWLFDNGKALARQFSQPGEAEKTLNKHLLSSLVSVAATHKLHRKLKRYQGGVLQRLARGLGLIRRLGGPTLARMEAGLPPVDAAPTSVRLPRVSPAVGGAAVRRAALFVGCVGDIAYGSIHDATVKLLTHSGCEVHIVAGQSCCGAAHHHMGDTAQAHLLLEANVRAFEACEPVDYIVTNAAGCGSMLKESAGMLGASADDFASRVRDVHEVLFDLWQKYPDRRPALQPLPQSAPVAVHQPCHLSHAQKVREQPRWLLSQIPGIDLRPLRNSDTCCGAAGVFSIVHPELADGIADDKMTSISASGASVIAAANLVCIGQLRIAAQRAGWTGRILHPVELLADAIVADSA